MNAFKKSFKSFKFLSLLLTFILTAFVLVGCLDLKVELSFEKDVYELHLDEQLTIEPIVEKGEDVGIVEVVYSIEDPTIATYVDGVVTPLAVGETTIRATYKVNSKHFAEATLKVLEPAVYQISYVLNGGENHPDNPVSYSMLTLPLMLKQPTKEWNTFKGWYETADFSGNKVTTLANGTTGNKTFYAKWEEVVVPEYTITYVLDDGVNSESNPEAYSAKTLPLVFEEPTKENYTFLGWYLNADFSGDVVTELDAEAEGDVILYAKWERSEYSITYHLDSGINDESNPDKYLSTDLPITLKEPTKEGYRFLGWYEKADFSGVAVTELGVGTTGDKELFAKFELITYTITYELNSGVNAGTNPASYAPSSLPISLAAPTKTGYVFGGWFESADFSTPVVTSIATGTTGDITLYAYFIQVVDYTISFVENGGVWGYASKDEMLVDFLTDFYEYVNPSVSLSDFMHGVGNTSGYAGPWFSTHKAKLYTINMREADASKPYFINQPQYNAKWLIFFDHIDMLIKEVNPTQSLWGSTYTGQMRFDQWVRGVSPFSSAQAARLPEFGAPLDKYNLTMGTVELPVPKREGYMFLGWYETEDFSGEPVTQLTPAVNSDKTFYALWGVEYNLAYELDGAVNHSENPDKYNTGYLPLELGEPTKAGYYFLGWYLAPDFSGEAVMEIAVGTTGDLTLYAQFVEIVDYSITFVENGGTWGYASKDEMLVDFLTDFYEYVNPSQSLSDFMHGVGNTSGYAGPWFSTHKAKLYTINMREADASKPYFINQPQYNAKWLVFFDHIDTLVKEVNPTQSLWGSTYTGQMRFDQWVRGVSPFSSAQAARLPEFSVSLTQYRITDDDIELPIPSKADFIFAGWYETEDFSGESVSVIKAGSMGNKTFYAKWTVNYTITYVLNDGVNDPANPETYNALDLPFVLVNPTREGYVFLGWYETEDFSGEVVTGLEANAEGDKTFYAKWEEVVPEEEYAITYVLNGGENDLTNPATYKASQLPLVLANPTRSGYKFLGWYETEDFSGEVVTGIELGSEVDKTFYAKWEEVVVVEEYNITYVLNDGTFVDAEVPYKYIKGVGVDKLPVVEKLGYEFVGWFSDDVLVTLIGVDATGDITLTAEFVEIETEFTVEYDLKGGEWQETIIDSYEDFRKALLADMTVYLQSLGWAGTGISLEANGTSDFMAVSFNYGTQIDAFFSSVYNAKWGWVWNFMASKGATFTSAALIRANVHGFVYQTKWASWPYSADYTEVQFSEFEALIPEQESQVGVDKYELGQTIAIPEPKKEGYIFVAWLLEDEVFEGITPETTGDLFLVAKWKKDFGGLDVIEVGPDKEVHTLAEALLLAEEGTIIMLAPGEYEGATIEVAGVTIQGPNADVDPNRETRTDEAVFISDIVVKADNVTISGITFKASIVADPNTSISGLTMEYLVAREFAAPSSTTAPLMFVPVTTEVVYTDIVLTNSRFEKVAGRIMIMYGMQIVNLSVIENEFLGTTSPTTIYNDGFKLAIAAAGGFDVRGEVEFISNHFENYQQYPLWIGRYGVGTYDFLDNTFLNCCETVANNQGAISMNNYTFTEGEKVVITVQFNTANNAQILARLRYTGATAENFEAYVNYNKMYNNINTVYITNQGYGVDNLIDASYNYYDKTPTESFFGGVSTWQPYYENEDDVPLYGQDINVFAIEYELGGGALPTNSPKNYDSRYGLETLPTPTHPTLVFVRWEKDGEKFEAIEAGTFGKIALTAVWREDALYVGESDEDYYYPTLTAALAAAKAGDKIILDAGVYADNLTITLPNLTIVGPNEGVNPYLEYRVEEAILTGKITVNVAAVNFKLDGLAFTEGATITGVRVIDFKFVNNYVYDTNVTTKAWQETAGYNEGFIYFMSSSGNESANLIFENNYFENVHNANINLSYLKNISFDGNVFKNFGRDAIRFDTGGYNYGLMSFTNNEFLQDTTGGYNGIYFRIYGGPGIDDTVIVIDGNRFVNIGVENASLYVGAISARNYQEKGAQIIIRNNEFEACRSYVRIRNNGTAANHAMSHYNVNIDNNAFLGIPVNVYFANWTGSDTATTNPLRTVFGENYYEDNEGNVISDLSAVASKFLNTVSIGTTLAEKPVMTKAEKGGFYKITYDLDGGTVSGLVSEYHNFTGEIVLPEPVKANHQFMGWYLGDERVESISAEARGDLLLVAHWQVLEGDFYDIEYVFEKGDWPTRDAASVQEVVDALFTDYYNWAVKYYNYKGSYEAFCKGSNGKYQTGYWYVTINDRMRNGTLMDETGQNEYFFNTPEYYYKWKEFFEAFDVAMKTVNPAQSFWVDTYAAMIRMYQFADWTQPSYYNAHLPAFYKAVQIPTLPVTTYRAGQEVVLKDLYFEGLEFLGWYDNPEFEGEPITKIQTTDSGDKVFYAKWEDEVLATEIIVIDEITELQRYTEHQLVWEFNPSNTSDQRVEIISSDPSIIFVTINGLLKALNEGTVTVRIRAIGGSQIDKVMTITVYSPAHFEISYETESYVEPGQTIKLNAEYINQDGTYASLVWESLNADLAEVNAEGVVTGVNPGLATIRVSVEGQPDVYQDFVVTVLSPEMSAALKEVVAAHESNIFTRYELGIGAGTPVYYRDIYGSVSQILYEDLVIDERYHAQGNAASGHGGVKSSTEFITVHYTGNMRNGSTASANANYFVNSSDLSIHYVTGNDGIFHALDDNLIAYHAGDGTGVAFYWSPTGVMAQPDDPKYPVWGITENSKYSINGIETSISVPTGTTAATQRVTDSRWLNMQGLAFKVVDGQYYMGNTRWDYSQIAEGRIGNYGGNRNSIGIESAVNEDSDLWYTWGKTAKLVAKLMLDNDLDITRVVGHHFFSAKDCPQPLLENDMEIWWIFIDMVEHEYELLTKYNDYSFELISDSEIINNKGRVVNNPMFSEVITYTVKVTHGETVEEITLASAINGIYSKE